MGTRTTDPGDEDEIDRPCVYTFAVESVERGGYPLLVHNLINQWYPWYDLKNHFEIVDSNVEF